MTPRPSPVCVSVDGTGRAVNVIVPTGLSKLNVPWPSAIANALPVKSIATSAAAAAPAADHDSANAKAKAIHLAWMALCLANFFMLPVNAVHTLRARTLPRVLRAR